MSDTLHPPERADAVQVNPAFAGQLREQGLRRFRDFVGYAGGQVIGGHPSRNVARVGWAGFRGILKREHYTPWKDYFASWWAGFGFVSKSRREWRVLSALQVLGIGCPEVVAVGEARGRAFLLLRELPNAVDLPTYLLGGHCQGAQARLQLARNVGRAVARLHAAGFTHPDLYAKHVFVSLDDGTVSFVDFQRTRYRHRVGWRSRWRDLAALDASLSDGLVTTAERCAGLAAYLRTTDRNHSPHLLHRSLEAIARRTRHLLRRRKIQMMRQLPPSTPPGLMHLEYFRVVVDEDGTPLPAAGGRLDR